MANDYEALAKALLNSRQDAQTAKVLGRLDKVLSSQEGQQLLTALSAGGADALKQAANAALQGDQNRARTALATLLSTKEGAALAARITAALGK